MLRTKIQRKIIKFICYLFDCPDIFDVLTEEVLKEKVLETALRIAISDLSLNNEPDLFNNKIINSKCAHYVERAYSLINANGVKK